jgi:ribosomal silencing factor RsfS
MCIVSGKSHRHMKAIAQFVRKIYKKKMHETDLIPILEGEASKDWMALDLGNKFYKYILVTFLYFYLFR